MFIPTVHEEQLPVAAVERDDFASVHPILDAGGRSAAAAPVNATTTPKIRMPWSRK
jgi:hypothetical protein